MRFEWSREGSTIDKSLKTMGCFPKSTFPPNLDRGQFRASPVSFFHDFGSIVGGCGGLRDVLGMALEVALIFIIFDDSEDGPKIDCPGAMEGD